MGARFVSSCGLKWSLGNNAFSNRIVDRWNFLSRDCINCTTTINTYMYSHLNGTLKKNRNRRHNITRRALGGAHLPPTKVCRRLTGSVNKTMLKALLAAAANRPTYTSDFPDVKFRAEMISEKESGSGIRTIIRIGLKS